MKLSVIFSTFNEQSNHFYTKSLEKLSRYKNIEVIVVDKKSSDKTKEIALTYGHQVIDSDSNARGKRLDEGFQKSRGQMILFHHPRSYISSTALDILLNNDELLWGGLTHQFDKKSPLLHFTSWYSNNVRGDIREIFYLDHCIYAKRELLEKIGGFPHDEIFEDTEASLRLREIAPSKRIHAISKTSSIRFEKNGRLRQALLNQVMKLCYLLGLDQRRMNKIYEFGLNLNSKY